LTVSIEMSCPKNNNHTTPPQNKKNKNNEKEMFKFHVVKQKAYELFDIAGLSTRPYHD